MWGPRFESFLTNNGFKWFTTFSLTNNIIVTLGNVSIRCHMGLAEKRVTLIRRTCIIKFRYLSYSLQSSQMKNEVNKNRLKLFSWLGWATDFSNCNKSFLFVWEEQKTENRSVFQLKFLNDPIEPLTFLLDLGSRRAGFLASLKFTRTLSDQLCDGSFI